MPRRRPPGPAAGPAPERGRPGHHPSGFRLTPSRCLQRSRHDQPQPQPQPQSQPRTGPRTGPSDPTQLEVVHNALSGIQELARLAGRHGAERFLELQGEVLDYTENLTRMRIRELPDGAWSFTDHVDDDGFGCGPIAIVANLVKEGDEIRVDFTGTSPQVKGAINNPLDSTKSMVYAVTRAILGGEIPNIGGYFRPVTVTAPEGTYVNPRPPAAVAARYLGCLRVSHAVFGAFARMLPDEVPACAGGCDGNLTMAGYRQEGNARKPWVQVEGSGEIASGASARHDGIDAQSGAVSNITNIPAELIEVEHPIRIEEYSLSSDSEGAGAFRGGVGLTRRYRFLADDTLVQLRSDRMNHPPYGLCGGQAAPPSRVSFARRGGPDEPMPSKLIVYAGEGDTLTIRMPGGGGWGDPLDRDPGGGARRREGREALAGARGGGLRRRAGRRRAPCRRRGDPRAPRDPPPERGGERRTLVPLSAARRGARASRSRSLYGGATGGSRGPRWARHSPRHRLAPPRSGRDPPPWARRREG